MKTSEGCTVKLIQIAVYLIVQIPLSLWMGRSINFFANEGSEVGFWLSYLISVFTGPLGVLFNVGVEVWRAIQ